jgi:hypothetical protein
MATRILIYFLEIETAQLDCHAENGFNCLVHKFFKPLEIQFIIEREDQFSCPNLQPLVGLFHFVCGGLVVL